MEINMTWVNMGMNDFGITIKYLGDKDYQECSETRLGWEIEKKVQDYIQRKLFWCRDEALEKYSEFETVWHLIENTVCEFEKRYPDRIKLKNNDDTSDTEEETS
jgi:hypothetical protein